MSPPQSFGLVPGPGITDSTQITRSTSTASPRRCLEYMMCRASFMRCDKTCNASDVEKCQDQRWIATLRGLRWRIVDAMPDTHCCLLFLTPRRTVPACRIGQTPKQQKDLTHHEQFLLVVFSFPCVYRRKSSASRYPPDPFHSSLIPLFPFWTKFHAMRLPTSVMLCIICIRTVCNAGYNTKAFPLDMKFSVCRWRTRS